MSATLRPARVPAPGRIIRRELEARGWTQKDLAHIMDRAEQTISQIVQGRRRVTPEMALELASAFGMSVDLWLNLEAAYRLHRARDEQDDSEVEAEANRLARDWLIDPEALREFVTATQPYFSEEKIRAFAESQGRHSGIVLGRLQYEQLVPYKNLRKLLVPVEKHLRSWIDVAEPDERPIREV